MDRGRINAGAFDRLRALAGKYKYVIAVVLLGTLLMLLPAGGGRTAGSAVPEEETRSDVQSEMEATLAAFDGVGRLRLMLTADPDSARWVGAAIVCEGAGSAAVRLELTRAVSALTGLPSDRIAVVKGRP